jgi:hypothetical protein
MVQKASKRPQKTVQKPTAKPVLRRVELGAPFEGKYLELDRKQLKVGFIADLQQSRMGPVIDGLARIVVGGDAYPEGSDLTAWLRDLDADEFGAICNGLTEIMVS